MLFLLSESTRTKILFRNGLSLLIYMEIIGHQVEKILFIWNRQRSNEVKAFKIAEKIKQKEMKQG